MDTSPRWPNEDRSPDFRITEITGCDGGREVDAWTQNALGAPFDFFWQRIHTEPAERQLWALGPVESSILTTDWNDRMVTLRVDHPGDLVGIQPGGIDENVCLEALSSSIAMLDLQLETSPPRIYADHLCFQQD